jgi:hypothetical protein
VPQGARRFTKIVKLLNEINLFWKYWDRGGEECSDCAKHNSTVRVLPFAVKKCSVAHQGVARTAGGI